MGELKCGPFELNLEDKVRLYPSVGSDSQRRELANIREEKIKAGRRLPAGVCNEELDRREGQWAETRPWRVEKRTES